MSDNIELAAVVGATCGFMVMVAAVDRAEFFDDRSFSSPFIQV